MSIYGVNYFEFVWEWEWEWAEGCFKFEPVDTCFDWDLWIAIVDIHLGIWSNVFVDSGEFMPKLNAPVASTVCK